MLSYYSIIRQYIQTIYNKQPITYNLQPITYNI